MPQFILINDPSTMRSDARSWKRKYRYVWIARGLIEAFYWIYMITDSRIKAIKGLQWQFMTIM